MIFLAFYLGGLVVSMIYSFMAAFGRNNSVKELWYAYLPTIFVSLLWPIVLPLTVYHLCFRDPKMQKAMYLSLLDELKSKN